MPKPKSIQPTETHIRILREILGLLRQGRAPVISELAAELGLAGPSSLSSTLDVVERLGLIKYVGGGQRGKRKLLSITTAGRAAAGQLGIPLLGSIPAGPLEEALENPESYVELSNLIPHEEGDFLLSVKGESMEGDGILRGDIVLLRPKVDARQGEIVAVHVGTDFAATLKHYHLDSDKRQVTLRASNPKYQDTIVPSDQVTVAGVYRGLIRNPAFNAFETKGYSYGI